MSCKFYLIFYFMYHKEIKKVLVIIFETMYFVLIQVNYYIYSNYYYVIWWYYFSQFMCWFSSLMVCLKSYCKNKHDSFETKTTVLEN